MILKEKDFATIRDNTVAIAGLGGVGTITAELLARWGVKRFRLIDLDRYSESNIMRQLFATPDTVGRLKAEVAAERIRTINPAAEIEMAICERSTKANAEKLIKGADIVIQTADTPSAMLLYQTAAKYKVPLVNGYCGNGKCYVQVFDYRSSSCKTFAEKLKDIIKWKNRKHIAEMSLDEMDALDTSQYSYETPCPPLNFVTNTAGCLMVCEAIKLILGCGRVAHYPKRINFDLLNLKMKVDNPYSFFKFENYIRLITLLKIRKHTAALEQRAGNKVQT
ncbi:MAG: ThiF family adenylyltransferase [Planctomycetota bacterium]